MPITVAAVATKQESGGALAHVFGKVVTSTDAAAGNVSLGFEPSLLIVFNYSNPSMHVYAKGMTAAYMMYLATGGTFSVVTSAALTLYAGDATHAAGFTYGTDATLNTAGDVLYYIAFR